MTRFNRNILILVCTCLVSAGIVPGKLGSQPPEVSGPEWRTLSKGLEFGEFSSPQPAEIGDSLIRVLRIDPQYYRFRLLNASAVDPGRLMTARQWCRRFGLTAAINASMYQADYLSSVSLMRSRSHVNNPRLSKDMSILAFDRLHPEIPLVKIIDRQCENYEVWRKKYRTFVQSIRMISCTGRNVWRQQSRKWSTAAIGIDHHDRVLFIYVGSPFSTHDLINNLMALPLDIVRAMYTEGGPQAQLYVNAGDHEYEFAGGREIRLKGIMGPEVSRPIPNVIAIFPR